RPRPDQHLHSPRQFRRKFPPVGLRWYLSVAAKGRQGKGEDKNTEGFHNNLHPAIISRSTLFSRFGTACGLAQNSRSARRRFPADPMLASVKLNRYAFSLRTEPSSYLRYSTLKPQQSQLYEVCSAPYCTDPRFRSSPTFAATPSPTFVGDPYPAST